MNDNYYANINQLGRFLSRPDERGYTFASSADERLIPIINHTLQEWADNKTGMTVNVCTLNNAQDKSLYAQLADAAMQADALVVTGLDGALADDGTLLNFNFSREELHAINKPILFWVNPNTLARLGNRANDLYSQRRMATVYFERHPDLIREDGIMLSRFDEEYRTKEEYEQLKLALNLQKKQLDEAETEALNPRRIAIDYALPLAESYSELDVHNEALALLDKYRAAWPEAASRQLQSRLASIFQNGKRYQDAIFWYEKVVAAAEEPDSSSSAALSALGDLYEEIGEYGKALEYYQQDLAISERLAKANPHSEQLQRDLGIAYAKLADLETNLGQLEQARARYEQSVALCERLAKANPHSEQLQRDLGIAIEKLADLETNLGQLEQARARYEQRLAISERLAKANPHSEQLQRDFSVALFKMARISASTGDEMAAEKYFQQDLEITKRLCQSNPLNWTFWEDLAVSLEEAAQRAAIQKNTKSADSYRIQAADTWLKVFELTGLEQFRKRANDARIPKGGKNNLFSKIQNTLSGLFRL